MNPHHRDRLVFIRVCSGMFEKDMVVPDPDTGRPVRLSWRIASEIGRDNSFCRENARRMKIIAWLALADAAYFWAGILVFWFVFGAASGPLLILSVLIGMVGVIIALCAGALSHLILKAAILREENDLTV